MKITTIYCDVCGKPDAKTSYFYVDRRLDPAGSMDDVSEDLDLCHDCSWLAYTIAEKKYGIPLGQHVFNELTARAMSRKK